MLNPKIILSSITTMAVIGFIVFTLYNQGILQITETSTMDKDLELSIVPVEIKDLQQYDELNGILEYGEDIEIKPSDSGVLTSIADEGSELHRGSLIFTFYSTHSETSLLSANQQIASANASIAQAELALENLQQSASKAQIASANASIAQAELALENLTNPVSTAQIASADASVAQAFNNLQSNKEQLKTKTTNLRIARKNYCDQSESLGFNTWGVISNICPEDGLVITKPAIETLYENIFKHDDLVTFGNNLLTAYNNYKISTESVNSSEVSLKSTQEQLNALITETPTEKQLDQANKNLESAIQHRVALDETPSDSQLKSSSASLENAKASLLTAKMNKENLYKNTGQFASILMFGEMPAWREIKEGMSAGPDIKQLKENLALLGYGLESSANQSNEIFTTMTKESIKKMQADFGINETGQISLGDIVFLPGKSVVQYDVNFPAIGSEVSANNVILSLLPIEEEYSSKKSGKSQSPKSLQKVSTTIPVVDKDLIEIGLQVKIELPSEIEIYGSISEIGKIAIIPAGNQAGDPYIEVSISLNQSYPTWTGADVIVFVTRNLASNVLAVPVTSLLSLLEGGYGLEVVTGNSTQLVPIEIGMYSGGWVEVESEYIKEGSQVINPK